MTPLADCVSLRPHGQSRRSVLEREHAMWRTWMGRGVCAGVLALLVPVSVWGQAAEEKKEAVPAPAPNKPPQARPKPAADPLVKPIADLLKRFLPQKPATAEPTVPAPAGDTPAKKPDEKPKKPRHPA